MVEPYKPIYTVKEAAGEAASTEKKEMYDWVLEETALIEAEVFLEE